jgi:hypothetical protein
MLGNIMVLTKVKKGKTIREIVKEEISHIPRGNAAQNELRMLYWPLRMHSLGKKAITHKTKKEILIEAINATKTSYPDFMAKYDEEFFDES